MAAARGAVLAAVTLAVCVGSGLPAREATAQGAVADFYRGKQVAILVGFSAGGSSSLYAQALTRVLPRHLPGSPTMIVQHMPGAGGLTVVNHIAGNAARDGTVMAITSRTAAMEPLLGNPAARFDPLKLNWIGTANVEHTTCVTWHTAPVKTLAQAMTTEAVVGGSGPAAGEVVFPRAANKFAGTRFKVVLGYPGSTELLVAMERGETHGFCGIGWTFLKLRKADWLAEKKINILFQIALGKHPDLPDVPVLIDHIKAPEDRKAMELILAPQEMGRPFFAPPEVPADRVAALRLAFERSLKDPQYLAEAEKMGIEVQHLGGEHIHALLQRVYATPKATVDRAKAAAQ